MINTLNLDSAVPMNIIGSYENADWREFELQYFGEDESTPLDISGEWQLLISKNPDFENIKYTITTANGLTVGSNSIQVNISLNIPKGEYWYMILNKIGEAVEVKMKGRMSVSVAPKFQA